MAAPPELEAAAGMAAPPEAQEALSRGFSEEQFGAACRELDQPAPAAAGPWQLLVETMGVRIYRLYHQQSGLYEYKIFGGLADIPPKLCADVYMDLDFRKKWDQYVKELYEETYDGEKVIYWEVKYPFPLSNRDVSFQVFVPLAVSATWPSRNPSIELIPSLGCTDLRSCSPLHEYMWYEEERGCLFPHRARAPIAELLLCRIESCRDTRKNLKEGLFVMELTCQLLIPPSDIVLTWLLNLQCSMSISGRAGRWMCRGGRSGLCWQKVWLFLSALRNLVLSELRAINKAW
uniref:Phosphatidylcholine transfer protein n=1 Tax=Junco hyemalis TaxID=40217 RepID=A0A8C5JE55_JUNHY